jgi:hypothetical protein
MQKSTLLSRLALALPASLLLAEAALAYPCNWVGAEAYNPHG